MATVAAVLALTLWRAGTLEQILHTGQQLNTGLPQTTQQTEPELLGKPVNDKAPQQMCIRDSINDLTRQTPYGYVKPAKKAKEGAGK